MKIVMFKLCFLLLLVSCGSTQRGNEPSINHTETKGDRNQRQFVEALDNITTKLNLPNLTNGADSFELRIWCPMTAYQQDVISIRYDYSQWNISEIYVWETFRDHDYKKNDTTNHLLDVNIDSTKSKSLHPKIENKKFIDTLLNKYVFSFPKKQDLAGSFLIGYDSYRYIFEIARKGNYEMLTYDCGGEIQDKKELHDKIRRFLDFIRRQLNETIPQCN